MIGIIIKLHDEKNNTDYYMEWSIIRGVPLSFGMNKEAFFHYIKEEYGNYGIKNLNKVIENVDATGASIRGSDKYISTLIQTNRAGKDDTSLSLEQIIDIFCMTQTEPS